MNYDDFVKTQENDEARAHWAVELSNGKRVYQDDGRPGCLPAQAWLRLADYVRSQGLKIRRMWLKYRDHEEHSLPEDAEGYFFCNAGLAVYGTTSMLSYFLIGVLQNGLVLIQQWSVPSLLLVQLESREASQAGECLIRNHPVISSVL